MNFSMEEIALFTFECTHMSLAIDQMKESR